MTQQLYTGLKAQRVNFEDDYHNWAKDVMIQKILTVMGIEWDYNDPDPTYVLTVDNLIKILAIQMRFRYSLAITYALTYIHVQVWYSCGADGRDWLWEDQTHQVHV